MGHLVYEDECVCACECVGVCVQMGEGRVLIPHSLCVVLQPQPHQLFFPVSGLIESLPHL